MLREDPKEMILREEVGISWCKGPEAAVERQAGWIMRGY